ncbi:MFS transporter [Nocardioides bigeumensis]|uniref:Major facilitator superfamily (MFS) profile domain-containing protein n=1 Tax=Nocardioides bigeumensis TaxID=433657 RepID=A0ABP5JCV7_9ACTN
MNAGAHQGAGQLRLGVVLTLAMGVGPLVIFTLSSLAPELVVDLSVQRVQLGILATVAYLAAAPLCLMAGPVLRWLHPTTVLLILFGLAAIALALIGGARSWWWLCSAAFLSGVVQSMSNPVTNLLMSTTPVRRRGSLMGVKQAGVQMGQLCAGIVALAALLVSWRAAALATVPICLLGLVLTLGLRRTHGPPTVVSVGPRGLPRAAWWLFAYSFFVAIAVQASNVYLPLFATDRIGLTSAVAGSTMTLIGLLGIASRIGWGRASDGARPASSSLRILAGTSLLAAGIFGLANATGNPVVLWTGVVVHAAGAIAANVVIIHALITIVRPEQVAAASGYQALAQYLGFAVGPLSFGLLVDRADGYAVGWCLVAMGYVMALTIARFAAIDR